MSNYKKQTVKNGAYGLLLQLVMIPLNFALRVILLKYIGVEFVGISGTTTSLVGILSLAEGGLGTAIGYCLYRPIVEKDYDKVNQLMSALQHLYACIGAFIMCVGAVLMLFLKYFFKGIDLTATVYAIFYLECINTAVSYLLCSRRTLLQADMNAYINNKIDIICNLIFTIIGIIIVFTTYNYILYLLVMIAKTIISNASVHVLCRKKYPFLHKTRAEKGTLKEILGYTRNLIYGNIASYIYNSTDNVLISTFTATKNVGYLSNYTMITNYLKLLSGSVLNAPVAAVGQKFIHSNNQEKKILYDKFSQICNLSAVCVCVPTYVLIDYFIGFVYGQEYVMSAAIGILLTAILYVYIAPFSYGLFLNASGRFDLSKKVEITGAFVNLFSSIILVQIFGIEGVLLGTVLSVIIQWVLRTIFVLKYILNSCKKDCFFALLKNFAFLFILIISIVCSKVIFQNISTGIFIADFMLGAAVSFVFSLFTYFLIYHFNDRIGILFLFNWAKQRRKSLFGRQGR